MIAAINSQLISHWCLNKTQQSDVFVVNEDSYLENELYFPEYVWWSEKLNRSNISTQYILLFISLVSTIYFLTGTSSVSVDSTSTNTFFIDTDSQRTPMTSALLITKTLKAPILMLLEHWWRQCRYFQRFSDQWRWGHQCFSHVSVGGVRAQ